MAKWVQHTSKQGEKWEVIDSFFCSNAWMVKAKMDGQHLILPKADYLETPLHVWRDVTSECEFNGDNIFHGTQKLAMAMPGHILNGYRFSKMEVNLIGPGVPHGCKKQWAFIIEKREEPS